MDWLNYHHLLYFWMVAREGSMVRASEQLHLAQPTLSSQIKKLEKSLGVQLFERAGRSLVLTDHGQVAFRYADEIFTLGRELVDVLEGRAGSDTLRLRVGVPDVLPKMVVHQLLKPALALPERVQLVSYEGKLDQLLADLALHRIDIVLSDSPLPSTMHVRAFSHLLGECGLTFLGTRDLAARFQPNFPQSLQGFTMLMPTTNTSLRRGLEQWFDELQVRPQVAHEFEDSALLKVFGQAGTGIFAVPRVIEAEVRRQYGVFLVGHTDEVKERFFALSVERRLKHPAVVAISQAARAQFRDLSSG